VTKPVDYYQVLGIPPRAHLRVIEESYWEQAHELKNQPTRKAQRRLSRLNEAYEVLGTPYRRARYDAERAGLRGTDGLARQGRCGRFLETFFGLFARPFRPG
jgi:curved DNA-binding protein CbpA